MAVDAKLITADEFAAMEPDDAVSELHRGEVVKMPPPGFEHALIVSTLTALLRDHVKRNSLGRVGNNGGFKIERDPDTVLAHDVFFIRHGLLSGADSPIRGYPDLAPDFVLEVVSPSDRASDVHRKVREYLAAGARLVAVIWPEDRSVSLSSPDGLTKTLSEDEYLEGGEVVPGFSVQVREIFD